MKVFVTGASGFIGRALVQDLIKHGHHVVGLARNEESAAVISKLGAEPHKGSLEDLESLKSAARACDGVVHLAFIHDFGNIDKSVVVDEAAIKAMIDALAGSDKPLVIAAGTAGLPAGVLATEDTEEVRDGSAFAKRGANGDAVLAASKEGVRGCVVRLPPTVHDVGDKAFIPRLINAAKRDGSVVFIGDGSNRWPAVNRQDAATLFRLVLERGRPGSIYHAIAESGVAIKDIASLISQKLSLPMEGKSVQEAFKTLNFLAYVLAGDKPASSEKTRNELGWIPVGIPLLEDMANNYFD
ncbi:hypothetical protein TRVA0_029S00144 [Trichomonascus vanleenenianus]|uniref:SDR family oxidoreductase n=1 Tax=Trichomonascus vanleenenianus TaxID=2268995 RepID=UPI003EC969D7